MNLFSFDLDLLGSIPGKCKYTYKESNKVLNVYVAIPTTNSDLASVLDLPKSFEVNLYYALKLTMTMAKIHKAGYLHGDI